MIHSYLYLSIILFCLGIVGVISRRNVFTVFMSIELMLNAANLTFIAFSRIHESMDGHVLAMMVMAVAAAEAPLRLLCHFTAQTQNKLDTNVFILLKG
jgi:NADH-quinone oxidoreductase subunit K